MQIAETLPDLARWRRMQTGSVGLVPTMGALHGGHLSLVGAARADNPSVIATIFVNPTQFAASEDFGSYPRTLADDLALLEHAGVDLVFAPTPDVMYPLGFQTSITVEHVSQGLEGERRPGHFRGVATVVAKLFNQTRADIAYFGQKDAQQVVVVRRMAADLNIPTEVVVMPTVREADGLAMSSRNRRLTPDQRRDAASLYLGLQSAAAEYERGERAPDRLIAACREALTPSGEIEYVALNDPHTLAPIQTPTDAPLLLSLVMRFGSTRLLDNALLPWSLNNRADLTAMLGAV
jgi:pantoate--beta-alanine ligase